MPNRTETDRIMWFSMWFLASIVTFGLAFFPMFYRSIERRNKHFLRQYEFEKRVMAFFRNKGKEVQPALSPLPERNAKLWTASIVLILPAFIITYFLSKDLLLHEKRQQAFLASIFPEREHALQIVSMRKYVLITVVTLGVGLVYWLYKLLNIYNNHFKEQRRIEKEIIRLMEENGYG